MANLEPTDRRDAEIASLKERVATLQSALERTFNRQWEIDAAFMEWQEKQHA